VRNDACPLNFNAPSLGGEAIRAHKSIKGYMEDLPAVGSTVCEAGEYYRKHNPLIDFSDTPPQSVVPYSQIGADLASNHYPTIAFVVPNVLNDMHDRSIAVGDAWLASNLPPIIDFNAKHNGLLILTWDEDDRGSHNHIATIAVGPMLRAGNDDQRIDHYSVLRTITDLFRLPPLDQAAPIAQLVH
ncbi:MAG: alkaline phosphatase family protein, partial [Candidatus Eremiobacteraeota bacterium]|nr:alkaline phosphatase family protein [Candidatus Eremiobacteraeota bacterium]